MVESLSALAAIEAGDIEGLRAALAAGADVNAPGSTGEIPLHVAAAAGAAAMVQVLLAAGAAENGVDGEGQTALHVAATGGHFEVVNLLVASGTAIDTRDQYGRTALWQAASNGFTETIDVLLAAGADLNAQDENGETPLFAALLAAHGAAANTLLAAGADVGTAERRNGLTPLHVAAAYGDQEMIRLLLNAGANPTTTDHAGGTAADTATAEGNYEAAAMLRPQPPAQAKTPGPEALFGDESPEPELAAAGTAAAAGTLPELAASTPAAPTSIAGEVSSGMDSGLPGQNSPLKFASNDEALTAGPLVGAEAAAEPPVEPRRRTTVAPAVTPAPPPTRFWSHERIREVVVVIAGIVAAAAILSNKPQIESGFRWIALNFPLLSREFPPMVESKGMVIDIAHVLNEPTILSIQSQVEAVKEKTGADIVLVTLDIVEPPALEEYHKLIDPDRVSSVSRRSAVVVLIGARNHKCSILVGKSFQRLLNGRRVDEIINQHIRPRLVAGDVNGAVAAGIETIRTSLIQLQESSVKAVPTVTPNHRANRAAGESSSRPTASSEPPVMVTIMSRPTGARVVVDHGTYSGITPLMIPLAPGKHSVQLAMEGYHSQTETIFVAAAGVNYAFELLQVTQ